MLLASWASWKIVNTECNFVPEIIFFIWYVWRMQCRQATWPSCKCKCRHELPALRDVQAVLTIHPFNNIMDHFCQKMLTTYFIHVTQHEVCCCITHCTTSVWFSRTAAALAYNLWINESFSQCTEAYFLVFHILKDIPVQHNHCFSCGWWPYKRRNS